MYYMGFITGCLLEVVLILKGKIEQRRCPQRAQTPLWASPGRL